MLRICQIVCQIEDLVPKSPYLGVPHANVLELAAQIANRPASGPEGG
jgi:hypothetical protein